jgi:5-methylcytosine-specific restriction enzyme subunit McrC
VTLVELDELGSPVELPLTPEQGRSLASSGVASAVPSTFRPGFWLIGPAGKVGAAWVGGLEIHIRPKVPIARLLFLAGYSQHAAAWRPETVPVAEAADLIPVVAQALWRQTERAIHQGLLPGYVPVEESSLVLRGRLRESEQLHRHHGLPLPLEIRHDEFTIDIPENQILRAACERMLTVPRVDAESQRMLRRLLRDFSEVTPLSRGDPVPAWQPTRLNARYHAALRLAGIVLRATSAEHEAGDVLLNGFLLDMPKLFEDFVTVALREALVAEFGGRVDGQDLHYLDQAGKVVLRPDIVWKVRGSPAAVIDAKYKAEKPAGYPNADLYQLLAYCTVLGLREGHLVYAKGNEEPARHVVRQSGIEIVCHALDLSQPPEALLGRISGLARAIASACPLYMATGRSRSTSRLNYSYQLSVRVVQRTLPRGIPFPGGGEPDRLGQLRIPEPVGQQHHRAAAFHGGQLLLVPGQHQLAAVARRVTGQRGQVRQGHHRALIGHDQRPRRDALVRRSASSRVVFAATCTPAARSSLVAFWEVAVPNTRPPPCAQARAAAASTRVFPVPAGPVMISTVRAEVSTCQAAATGPAVPWPGPR